MANTEPGPNASSTPGMALDGNLLRIKRNVAKMASMRAPEAEIDAYIAHEGVTLDQVRKAPLVPRPFDKSGAKAMDLPGAGGSATPSTNLEDPNGRQVFAEGIPANVAAGLNATIYGTLGGFADRVQNIENWGIAAANFLAGKKDLTDGMIRVEPVLGSRWLAKTFEKIGVRDPDSVIANSLADKLARMAGEGAGMTIAPEMLLAAFSRAGIVGDKATKLLGQMLGDSTTVGGLAKNAVAGAAGSVGAQLAADAAPPSLKPVAATLGGLAGGAGGALAAEGPALARAGGRLAADYVAPLTTGGRERLAGAELRDAASSPGAVLDAIDNTPSELVPGSKPTLFQQTGDMGIGSAERVAATKDPAAFQQRRADQNGARLAAVEGMQPDGAPDAVVTAIRERLAQIDRDENANVAKARGRALGNAESIGPALSPDVAGSALRNRYETARAGAKEQERALWAAVDPDGTLVLASTNTAAGAKRILGDIPRTAKPMEGEEAAIFRVASEFGNAVKFADATALQSRLKTAMREERSKSGESAAWRRMSMLNSAIQRDLESVIARKVDADAVAVSAGRMRPEDATAARIGVAQAPAAGNRVFTATGRPVDVEYRVVDAGRLVTSNLDNLSPNPAYPPALQPRNRARTASEVQIAKMAGELQPERLGASPSAAEGAPIVGPDGLVESGNARVLAIRRAYSQGGDAARRYREFLKQQGYDVGSMANPVLVRVRKSQMTDAERVRFAQEANSSAGLSMSAGERAASDASRLDGSVLDLYQGGDVGSAANRPFVRAFLGKVADPNEAGAFVTRDGTLSLEGAQRVRGALLSAAYDDAPLVEALIEAGDDNIRAFGHALGDIAGEVASLKTAIRDGMVSPGADLSAPLVEAASFVREARRRGQSLSTAASQLDAFSRLSKDAENVLRAGYGQNLAARLSREEFVGMMRRAVATAKQQTMDARLFGEPALAGDILTAVGDTNGGRTATRTVTSGAVDPWQGNGAGGDRPGQPGAGPAGSAGASGREGGGGNAILEPQITPNFGQADLKRLNAARAATRNRAETFDNPTLAPIRRRDMASGPYDMPASAVAPKLFFSGPKSFDAIKSYRAAVGDDEAMNALRGYAIDRLRIAATRADGTLDPAKATTWLRSHSDALRALPALEQQVRKAAASTEALDDAIAAAKSAHDDHAQGLVGRLLGLENVDDIRRTIGTVFGRSDAVAQMQRLRKSLNGNAEAEEGLRRSIAQWISERYVGNAEAATSGQGTLKADQFTSFAKNNQAAMRAAGFTEEQIGILTKVAEDVQRANRSLSAVKIPGQSNSAQDLAALAKQGKFHTVFGKVLLGLASVGGFSQLVGLWPTAVGVGAGIGVRFLRSRGIKQIGDLVTEALLDPQLAKRLMQRAGDIPPTLMPPASDIALRASRGAGVGAALSFDRNRTAPSLRASSAGLPMSQRGIL